MRLRIFKSARNKAEKGDDEENLPHGTKVLSEIILPWVNTDRIVCENSYFASVPDSEELWKRGIHFIGVIKTETHKFMMVYMSNIELQNRGDIS